MNDIDQSFLKFDDIFFLILVVWTSSKGPRRKMILQNHKIWQLKDNGTPTTN